MRNMVWDMKMRVVGAVIVAVPVEVRSAGLKTCWLRPRRVAKIWRRRDSIARMRAVGVGRGDGGDM